MPQAWVLPDEVLSAYFKQAKTRIEKNNDKIFFDWSRPVLSEISPNVERSLNGKFASCEEEGYSAIKIAAIYTFWIAKLKPGFTILETAVAVNEWLGLVVGIGIIRERLGVDICLSQDELVSVCETLRYHTSSPHMLYHLYSGWIERERLRQAAKPA